MTLVPIWLLLCELVVTPKLPLFANHSFSLKDLIDCSVVQTALSMFGDKQC